MHNILCGPTKAVCYKEVSTIRELFKRFYCSFGIHTLSCLKAICLTASAVHVSDDISILVKYCMCFNFCVV